MTRTDPKRPHFGGWHLTALLATLLTTLPLPALAQYHCFSQPGTPGCYFDCGPGGPGYTNGAIHICTCDGSSQSPPPQYTSGMGAACYNIGSHCAVWETYPHSTNNCYQWACTPGQSCTANNGCGGTCVYTPPSSGSSGTPTACVAGPSAPTCGDRCCAANEACVNNACLPLCDGSPYDPANQCCVDDEDIRSKFVIEDLDHCPGRSPRPGWDPNAPSNHSACGTKKSLLDVPDSFSTPFGTANFTPSCNAHDACYGTCNSNKATCDTNLKDGVAASCQSAFNTPAKATDLTRCLRIAPEYHWAVRLFGGGAYEDAQKEACICCP